MSLLADHLGAAAPAPVWSKPLRLAPASAWSAILFLAMAAWLVATGPRLLADPDTQWHCFIGGWIWSAGSVPTTDLFSHTEAGSPWMAKEWLSQLGLFAAYHVAGWRGVVILTALAIASAFATLYDWLRRRIDPLAALAVTLVAIILTQPHFLARPHMLVLPVIVLWMTGLASARERGEAPPLWLASLMMLWANLHGSFPLGLVMAGLLAIEAVLATPRAARGRVLRGWIVFLLVALASTAVSPYGWHAILVPLRMSGNARTLAYVDEWRPLGPDFMGIGAMALCAALLGILARDARRNLIRMMAIVLVAGLMARHARFVGLFAVIAPILATAGATRWPGLAPKRWSRRSRIPAPALAALAVAALVAAMVARPEPDPDVTPDAAYRYALAAGVSGPVYNDYDFGGYLIAHNVKTFVDGRTDQLFLGDFLPDLARAITSPDDAPFADLLSRHGVTWALVRADSREEHHLAASGGWTPIYSDDVASVYIKTP